MQPWHKLVVPRKEVRVGRSFNPDELRLHLGQIEAIERGITRLEREIDKLIGPFRTAVKRLRTMPGVSDTVPQGIVAEIGTDMSRFPTPGH